MANTELRVIIKAKELVKHTFKITLNTNRYPKKLRYSLVDKMQNKCMEIYESLYEANRTDIRYFKRERQELQTKAITYCDQLLYYIELSHDLKLIDMGSMEYWSKLVSDVRNLALAWRTKDRTR